MRNKSTVGVGKKLITSSVAVFILFCALLSIPIGSYAGGDVFIPSFGVGKTNVRIYTDYFCPPCRAMEPRLDPIISKLIKDGIINLTFIDTPFYRHSALYARYFLYALNENTDMEHALTVRKFLTEAANKRVGSAGELEDILRTKNVAIKPFDTQPTFNTLSGYLKNDEINATPTCIIEINGKKERYTGADEIINALNNLKKELKK